MMWQRILGPVRQGFNSGVWICLTRLSVCMCVCVCVSVCDRWQKQARHHTQSNIWLLPQLCLQSCIIPVTQPEVALLWQSIYYSQASCFCLRVSVTHTLEEVFLSPLNTRVRIPCSILGWGLTCSLWPDSAFDFCFIPQALLQNTHFP